MSAEYQIYFLSTTADSGQMINIALDDIKVTTSDQCQSSTTTTPTPTTTQPVPTIYACDFEKNKCQWSDDTKAGEYQRMDRKLDYLPVLFHF